MKAITPYYYREVQKKAFARFLLYWVIGLNIAFWGMVVLMTFYN